VQGLVALGACSPAAAKADAGHGRRTAAVVAVLFQALPTASSSLMARQMGGNAPLMATIVALQTVAAAATLPLVLMLTLS